MNYLSLLFAVVAATVVGFLWYGPLFGKKWKVASGYTDEEMQAAKMQGMGKTYTLMTLGTILIAYVLANTLYMLGVDSASAALQTAFWLWLGFVVPVKLNDKLFGKNKSKALFLIDAGHYLAGMAAMSLVLTLWQ